ncbi:MAG: NAD-glutamate dehydrogenase [Candidatus Omnitrophica bacterium]|nr:NAD-glutamate dehydrogenase [Candidatus Omnitrophota bacterium]
MFTVKDRYILLSKAIALAMACLFLVNDIAIAQPSVSTLAPLAASENPRVKREITASMYRASRFIWLANSPRYLDLLSRYNALALLLPSGRYLMAPETAANDLLLIRSAIHEDNEILMQQEENLHPTRYNRLMRQVLGRDDIMKLYRVLSHYKEPNKQPNNIIFNDLISKAFEILSIIDEDLVYPSELKLEEREFIALMRPILQAKDSRDRYKNFSQVFFDTDKRTKAIKALQENKDERFYRVASENKDAGFEGAAIRIWEDALGLTAGCLRIPQSEVISRLNSLDKEAHSQFRFILSQRVANYLGSCSSGIDKIYLFGSVNGEADDIGPCSDIDMLIQVSSSEVKGPVTERVDAINKHVTVRFNEIMAASGMSIGSLIDVSNKIVTGDDIMAKRGFAQVAASIYDPSRILYDRKEDGFFTPDEATEELKALPIMGNEEAFKEYNAKAGNGITKKDYLGGFARDMDRAGRILQMTRPVDELNKLVEEYGVEIKQLDILRAVSEIILQLVSPQEGVDNIERLSRIRKVFAKHPEISKRLIKYFETRFDPAKDLDTRGEESGNMRLELLKILEDLNGDLHDKGIFQKALGIMIAAVKTDYYVKKRTELFLSIVPRAIVLYDEHGSLVHTPPYAIIWVHVPYGAFGLHSRYADVARGGLRCIRPERTNLMNNLMSECVALSTTQNRKHTDISEGGSKGAFVYHEGLNRIAAVMGYVDGLIGTALVDENIAVASGGAAIDPLELGPDEGTGEFGDFITARAYMRGLGTWRIFMTGKSALLDGVSHMENDLLSPPERGNRVTSQGVMAHAFEFARYLRERGAIRPSSAGPITLSVTGWLDGDVASGIVERSIDHYGDNVAIRSGTDISGVVFDPSLEGLDHAVLLQMYRSKSPAKIFPKDRLHAGGFVAVARPGSGSENYTILGPESLKAMNTRALDPEVLRKLGVEEKYKSQAGLKDGEDLITVLERDSNGRPVRIRAHNMYIRDAMFFLASSDMLITGGGVRNSIDNKNWELFFDWDGKPVSAGMVHGANVFTEKNASINLERRGVGIEPDEKANSVGVEISSKMEVDFNLLFKESETTPALMSSYFEQILAKCLENAVWKFWALRIEAEDRPGESVVAQVSPAMSAEIIKLHEIILNSDLIGERKESYEEAIIKRLEQYFPDVRTLDKAYEKRSSLDRVFDSMPVARLKMTAAKLIAKELVFDLGMRTVRDLAKNYNVAETDVIRAYLKEAARFNTYKNVKSVIDNKEYLLPSGQIKLLRELRENLIKAISNRLASKTASGIAWKLTSLPAALKSTQGPIVSVQREYVEPPEKFEKIHSNVQQAFSALNSEAREESQLSTSVSKLRGTSQNLMDVNKFRFCLPIEVLRNSPDIALALNSTGLLKQKPQDAENVEFELVVTGVTEEDVKLIEGLNRDDIKKALNLPKKFTVSVITEAQIQETAQRFGYDASNPKNRVAIVKDFFSGALAKGEYMAIATDALDSTEKADALKEELERELKAELSQENISIRVLVRPESGKSMYSLSKIINDWLDAINQGNFSTISRILPIPAPLTPELERAIRTAWAVLIAA